MIKINSDPTVYVVGAGGEIGHSSEEVAEALYGSLEPRDPRRSRWILLKLHHGF